MRTVHVPASANTASNPAVSVNQAMRAGKVGAKSVSPPLVHEIAQRLALTVTLEIIQEELHGALLPVRRMIRGVRREQHIVQTEIWMARRQRLLVEHIQRRAANALLPQRRD